ncbi:MAG: 4-(cytidine 5'-diphospho)-2-C-methyl-D-erythritol kinase [Bacteroidota bacterium]
MVVFPNCKINLGLKILDKRPDGFHNLQTIFYPLKINDALEVIKATDFTEFSSSGIKIDGDIENNLCIKAFDLLKKDYPDLPSIKIHLHKAIPIGAGLGGGSADATFTLQLLNTKFQLNITDSQLAGYALQLGSDCPFFLLNKPCSASGRGENLEPISVDLSAYNILIVHPGIHINTGWAFTALNSLPKTVSTDIRPNDMSTWINDFEAVVFEKYPEIKKIKEKMYEAGAIYASMSGSGSTVFGLFEKKINISIDLPVSYYQKTLDL